jgi:hypothetical protein
VSALWVISHLPRWDEKAGILGGLAVKLPRRNALEGAIKKETGHEKG